MGGTSTATATEELQKVIPTIDGRIVLGIFKVRMSADYTAGGDIVDLRKYFHRIQGIMALTTEDADGITVNYDDANYNTTSALAYAQAFSTQGVEITSATNLSTYYHRILVIGE